MVVVVAKCEVGEVTDRACASDLQTCLDGICRPTTQLGECVEGTIPRNGVCVSKCQRGTFIWYFRGCVLYSKKT